MNWIPDKKQYARAERDMTRVLKDLGIEHPKAKAEALLSDILVHEIGRAMGH